MEKTVFLDNGNYLIPAVTTVSEGNGPFGAVVMLHGTGSDKDEAGNAYKIMANEFAAAGIASIRIDFVGTGESQEDYSNYNYETAISDANFSADFISKFENAVSKNNESEFLVIDEADHTFNVFSEMTMINEVVAKTVKWFVRTLNNH